MDNGHGPSANGARKKHISVVTPCYNEERQRPRPVRGRQAGVRRSSGSIHLRTHFHRQRLQGRHRRRSSRRSPREDRNVKIIVNARNFGHIRSPYHALLQARGDAVLSIVADLQDPPSMIPEFLAKWEEGYKVVHRRQDRRPRSRP